MGVISAPEPPFSEIRQDEARDAVSLHTATIQVAASDIMESMLRALGRGGAGVLQPNASPGRTWDSGTPSPSGLDWASLLPRVQLFGLASNREQVLNHFRQARPEVGDALQSLAAHVPVDQAQVLLQLLDGPGGLAIGLHPLVRRILKFQPVTLVRQRLDNALVEGTPVAGDGRSRHAVRDAVLLT
jgi:hypothetical protein